MAWVTESKCVPPEKSNATLPLSLFIPDPTFPVRTGQPRPLHTAPPAWGFRPRSASTSLAASPSPEYRGQWCILLYPFCSHRRGRAWQHTPPRACQSWWTWFCSKCTISGNQFKAGWATGLIPIYYIMQLCDFLSPSTEAWAHASGDALCQEGRGGVPCSGCCWEKGGPRPPASLQWPFGTSSYTEQPVIALKAGLLYLQVVLNVGQTNIMREKESNIPVDSYLRC